MYTGVLFYWLDGYTCASSKFSAILWWPAFVEEKDRNHRESQLSISKFLVNILIWGTIWSHSELGINIYLLGDCDKKYSVPLLYHAEKNYIMPKTRQMHIHLNLIIQTQMSHFLNWITVNLKKSFGWFEVLVNFIYPN